MIEETVFTHKEITKVIKNIYNINIYKIEKLNRGSANIYALNENKFILKEFQTKYTEDEINKEIIIINHLKNDNIPVAEYIKTVNGKYSFIYKNKIIIMQKFIDGYTVKSNAGNHTQILESAKYLGKIIKSLSTLNIELPNNDVLNWCSNETIDKSIEKHEKILKEMAVKNNPQIYNDIENKISMLRYVKNNFDFSNMDKLTIMNTHGDYSVLQFIYRNGKVSAILDFATACKMPIVWEIIRSYSYIDPKAKDGNIDIKNLVEYVKVFTKYIKLNKHDLKMMPYLYLIQLLESTYGYKQFITDNSKTNLLDFASYRTKLCSFLFKNSEKIANALMIN